MTTTFKELFDRLVLEWLWSKGIKGALRVDGYDDFAYTTKYYGQETMEYETEIYYSTSLTNRKKQWQTFTYKGKVLELLDELADREIE